MTSAVGHSQLDRTLLSEWVQIRHNPTFLPLVCNLTYDVAFTCQNKGSASLIRKVSGMSSRPLCTEHCLTSGFESMTEGAWTSWYSMWLRQQLHIALVFEEVSARQTFQMPPRSSDVYSIFSVDLRYRFASVRHRHGRILSGSMMFQLTLRVSVSPSVAIPCKFVTVWQVP